MKKKNKLIGFMVGVCSLLVFGNSYACSCIGKNDTKTELKSSDFVFKGRVIERLVFVIDTISNNEYVYNVKYKFKVEIIFKGKKKYRTKEIIITTGIGNGDCGYEFEEGKEYIVYSNWKNKYFSAGNKFDKFLYTNICKRTTSKVNEEGIQIKKYRKICKWFKP